MNHSTQCQNCQTALQGRYCHRCGQDSLHTIRFFGEVLLDLLSTFFSYDSKANRSLQPLLFKPGFLSNEYIAGRRQRYLSPFRLYLFASVVCFLTLSLQTDISIGSTGNPTTTSVQKIIDQANTESEDSNGEKLSLSLDLPFEVPGLNDFLNVQAQILGQLTDRQLIQLIYDTLPMMMLILLPVLAAILKLLYLGSRRYYTEHFIVVLHSQSFLFIVISLMELQQWLGSKLWSAETTPGAYSLLGTALTLWAFAYIPLMLRRVYQQSRRVTLLKFSTLLICYFFLSLVMLLLSFAWNVVIL
jgi:hypothetical protein